jgi:4-hydroxy-3-polyprenylbenzoate decarboxylase
VVRSAVAPRDVRQLCAQLESRGWLHRVPTPVSADGEVAEVAARSARRGGPALLFGQVEGKRGALLVDAFGSEERVALALGVGRVEELGERLGGVVGAARAALAGGVGDRLKALGGLAQVGQVGPRRVARAASGRVEARSLEELPVPSGQALESAVLFEDGQRARAVGLEIGAERSLRVLGPPAARASAAAPARIALGADPATIFAASIPLPHDLDPLLLAGFLRRAPVETVDGVPAQAEWLIEGRLHADTFEVSRITSRRDPVLPWSTPGREQRWLTRAAERLFLPLVRLVHAEVVDLAAPVEGGFRGLVLASIRKEYPGQPQKVIAGLFGMMPTMQSRAVIVLDEDVPLDDPAACAAAVVRHVDWRRDVMVLDGPVDGGVATKLGVDATAKRGGAPRSPNGQHAADVAALVDRKWASYGMPL